MIWASTLKNFQIILILDKHERFDPLLVQIQAKFLQIIKASISNFFDNTPKILEFYPN